MATFNVRHSIVCALLLTACVLPFRAVAIGGSSGDYYNPVLAFVSTLAVSVIGAALAAIASTLGFRLFHRPLSWRSSWKWVLIGSVAAGSLATLDSLADYGLSVIPASLLAFAVYFLALAAVYAIASIVRRACRVRSDSAS